MGFTEPTPIQQEIIPMVLEGRDCLAQAPTGTGKTSAFGIPIINMLDLSITGVQAIILCPTRELVMQIDAELKRLAKNSEGVKILSIYGGQDIERQLAGIRKRPQIIVGTTGRVMDHLRRKTLKIKDAKVIVLDEADEMLDMGFREDIDTILKEMPEHIQTLLFSATLPKEILEISKSYQTNPACVKTTCSGQDLPDIKQYLVNVKEANKYSALKQIISEKNYKSVLVFCNTKVRVDEINKKLNGDFYLSMALHGDLRQRERDKVMRCFRQKAINILVATDIAARGIDVDDIEAIFNFDIPYDDEYYIHRIGRTARANKSGVSYSFANSKDGARVKQCEKLTKTRMEEIALSGISIEHSERAQKDFDKPTTRMFINVGVKDGATKEKVIGFITSKSKIKAADIYDVKLLDIFGFIEVDSNLVEEALTLKGEKCFNRKFAIEVSVDKPFKSGDKQYVRKSGSFNDKSDDRPRKSFVKSEDRPHGNYTKTEEKPRRNYDDRPHSNYIKSEDKSRGNFAKSDDNRKVYENSAEPSEGYKKSAEKHKPAARKYDDNNGGFEKARSEDGYKKPAYEKKTYADKPKNFDKPAEKQNNEISYDAVTGQITDNTEPWYKGRPSHGKPAAKSDYSSKPKTDRSSAENGESGNKRPARPSPYGKKAETGAGFNKSEKSGYGNKYKKTSSKPAFTAEVANGFAPPKRKSK